MIPILGIPIVNGFHWLERLINSIDFQIETLIILNNNSDDIDLVNNLENLKNKQYNYINKIKICHLPSNIGVAASWNLIIKSNINSPYWIISNHDIGFTPGLLKEFYDQSQNKDIGIVHGSGGDFGDGSYDVFLIKDWVIQKIGLFDENFYPAYCEDADYIMRLHNYKRINNESIKTISLNIPYYHGHQLSDEFNCYISSGKQTGKESLGCLEKLDRVNIQNFDYMNKKWGEGWRITNPQKFPLLVDNMPLSYTSYDLEFCRSKYIDFNSNKLDKLFDWGPMDPKLRDIFIHEIFIDKVYERFYKIKNGDIILDIGANCGAFSYSLKDHDIKHIYCIEPSKVLFPILQRNLTNNISCTLINKGICHLNDDNKIKEPTDIIYCDESNNFSAITFESFIKEYNIKKVNLLKFDCEGCEASIFDENNSKYIKNNIANIVGEYHIVGHDNSINNFKIFRDIYLKDLQNTDHLYVFERGGRNVTKEIFDDAYLDSFKEWWTAHAPDYGQFIIYANLESLCEKKSEIFFIDSNASEEHGIINTNQFIINTKQDPRFFVVDNFYEDPIAVREFALSQTYFPGEGAVGYRTRKQFLFEGLRERFEQIIGQKIPDHTDDNYGWKDIGINGRFQYCPAGTNLVYHCDHQKWAATIYLTPDAPPSCGTSFFRHKETKVYHDSQIDWNTNGNKVFNQHTFLDRTPYECIDNIGNIFNRLVIFDGGLIHSASEYFGWDINTSRLFHIFFFN